MTMASELMEKGEKKGKEEGEKKGKKEGLQEMACIGLELKYGKEGLQLCEKINAIDSKEKLQTLIEILMTSNSIDKIKDLI